MVSVSVGCGCGTQRGSVHCCVPQCHFLVQFAAYTVQQLLLPLCRIFPTVSRGLVVWRESKFWKMGVRWGFFVFFLKFQSLFAEISNIQNIKDKQENKNIRQTSSGGHRLWTEERSMVYIAQCNCHLKVELRFFSSENWPTIKAAGLHNKSVIRKFDKAPESNWIPILKVTRRIRAHRGQWLGATGHTYS